MIIRNENIFMMKKLLIFFIAAFLSVVYVNGQSELELQWDGKVLNDTVYVWVDPYLTDATIFHAEVFNKTDNILNVKVLRTNIDVVEGSVNSFCWASQCYPPFLDESGDYQPIIGGESSGENNFYAEFVANETFGISIVKYKFFDKDNPDIYKEVVVKYWSSPEAIEEEIANLISFSNAYPNPAINKFNIDYNFDTNINKASLKIVNLLGSVVKEVEIDQNSNKLSMDISNLDSGVYFYSIVVDNQILQTKKLVIR